MQDTTDSLEKYPEVFLGIDAPDIGHNRSVSW